VLASIMPLMNRSKSADVTDSFSCRRAARAASIENGAPFTSWASTTKGTGGPDKGLLGSAVAEGVFSAIKMTEKYTKKKTQAKHNVKLSQYISPMPSDSESESVP